MIFLNFSAFFPGQILAKNFGSSKFAEIAGMGVFRAQESDSELKNGRKSRPKPTFAYRLTVTPAKSGWQFQNPPLNRIQTPYSPGQIDSAPPKTEANFKFRNPKPAGNPQTQTPLPPLLHIR